MDHSIIFTTEGTIAFPFFFKRNNYLFFLTKVRKHLLRHIDLVAYCLMPNHFHLLTYPKSGFVKEQFSADLKIMLRSYTRAINIQEGRTGSLFQQNTKIKPLNELKGLPRKESGDPFICFHYIHQNPVKAGLAMRMEEWEMSSFRDYASLRKGTLCNKELAYHLLEIPASGAAFVEQSVRVKAP